MLNPRFCAEQRQGESQPERYAEKFMAAEMQAKVAESLPLRRLGTPEDVAQAALFLASDASSWITGHALDVSGGKIML